jgi:hypothetical protein
MARKQLYVKYERVIYTDTDAAYEAVILSRPKTGDVYVILPIENLTTGERQVHPREIMVYASALKPCTIPREAAPHEGDMP